MLGKVHYIIGVLGVATAALAAALGDEYGRYFSVASGICIAVLGFVQPQHRYQRFIGAWRGLDIAILKYKLGKATVDDLIQAVERGEEQITETQDRPAMHTTETSDSHPKS